MLLLALICLTSVRQCSLSNFLWFKIRKTSAQLHFKMQDMYAVTLAYSSEICYSLKGMIWSPIGQIKTILPNAALVVALSVCSRLHKPLITSSGLLMSPSMGATSWDLGVAVQFCISHLIGKWSAKEWSVLGHPQEPSHKAQFLLVGSKACRDRIHPLSSEHGFLQKTQLTSCSFHW